MHPLHRQNDDDCKVISANYLGSKIRTREWWEWISLLNGLQDPMLLFQRGLALWLLFGDAVQAFYLPGVNPQNFEAGDP